ncbi:hypothetical protein AMJ83_08745 [candidate division WOR_3 bacterium SM23_42]|uniref:Magnetosome protein MamS/MamX domain-containing protein n=1 Tax=candidate division WOR_3 bacterium SM23_42 TaxID=1703779 RepID=A0A0S8FSM9_UNCW3|nr:MAG: hypothetical protein AMJ83_08745 [candidate division WOR_3 bacterium SM23_42]
MTNKMLAAFILPIMTVALLPAQEVELTGEVSKVEEIATNEGDVNIVRAQIQTRNRETVMAHLGPAWMMDSDVKIGDAVTVRGKYNEENRFMVREMVRNNVQSSAMMEAMVESQNGELVRVRLAPEWHLRNRLRVGDELDLRGSAVKDEDAMTIMAREMRNTRTRMEMELRNEQGFPDWFGKGQSADEPHRKPYHNDENMGRGRGQHR